tara:strand:- start:5091 stop:5789 length:699 start_codon:yes stop_codon:yes gene_type:complete
MKLRVNKGTKYNLILKNLIKTEVNVESMKNKLSRADLNFVQGFKNNFCIFNLKYIELSLKKSLNLIYSFNRQDKKILFLGELKPNNEKFNDFYKIKGNYFLPVNCKINGFLSNKKYILYHIKSRKNKLFFNYSNFRNLLKKFKGIWGMDTIKKPDLIVILSHNYDPFFLEEAIKLNIPVISLLGGEKIKEMNGKTYKIIGSFKKEKSVEFIYSCLISMFTKSLKYNTNNEFK